MKFVDYYSILGVSRDASTNEIRKRYRELAQEFHYDKLRNKFDNGEISKEKFDSINDYFKEMTAAYTVLINSKDRLEYDKLYDKNQRIEEEKRRKKEESKKEESKKDKRDTEVYDGGFFYDLKKSYKDIKKEERKSPSFIKRHQNLDDYFYDNYYFDNMSTGTNIMFQTGRGIVHVSGEFLYNIYKLKYITKDSIPKYIIRNRRLAALLVAGVITVNGIGLLNNNDNVVEESNAVSNNDIVEVKNEIPETITLTRYYTIKGGDTLSRIAEDSGTSQSKLQSLNNISQPSYIRAGEEIIIPYTISNDDLSYYTYSVEFDRNVSLNEFARKYDTDSDTLIKLNEEAIINDHGVYVVLSDSLNVPNFISKEELNKKIQRQF